MRLLNPSPGEIVDRLTILELKIYNAEKRKISFVHFAAEKVSLIEALKGWESGVVEDCVGDEKAYDDKMLVIRQNKNGLSAINSLLWRAEDEVRASSVNDSFKLARLCKSIASWNDARARYVQALNKAYGLESEPEKLHEEMKEEVIVTDPELGMN